MKSIFGSMTLVLIAIVLALPSAAQTVESQPWDAILQNHRAKWVNAPASIQIRGTSTRGAVTQAVTITANNQEDTVVEIGQEKEVATAKHFFKEDGDRTVARNTPAGFTQLDVTGVFFLAQLRNRSVQTEKPVLTTFRGAKAWRIHAEGPRSEMHYLRLPVKDAFDVYLDESGLLLAIERTFYKEEPLLKATMTLVFSDNRPSAGGVILPHRIERFVKGSKVETIIVQNYIFDIPTTHEQFEPRRPRR